MDIKRGEVLSVMEKTGKILTVQDLSCVGQCSLTVALPILSSFGLETAVLPTAILSEHTAFQHFTFLDLAENMKNTLESWKKDGHKFSAIYTGYLGDIRHFDIVGEIIDSCGEEGLFTVIDPAFGDNGKLYPLFDEKYVDGMRKFISRADVVLPNVTEACYLLKREYLTSYTREDILTVLRELSGMGGCNVLLTGFSENGKIGFAAYDKKTEKAAYYLTDYVKGAFHGTGDIFASAFTGAYLNGKPLYEAGKVAAEFVKKAILATEDGHDYGVRFEKVLAKGTDE